MAIFLKKLAIFLLIISAIVCLLELAIPYQINSFRNWEHLRVYNTQLFQGPFYPNFQGTRNEYGDLAHHTPYQVKKENIRWITDSLGFRNEKSLSTPDIVIIGRSNITGSSLSQEDIISSQIQSKTNLSTYNISPVDFQDFMRILEQGTIKKPQILIYGCIEKQIPNLKLPREIYPSNPYKSQLKNWVYSLPSGIRITIDKLIRRNTKKFLQARIHRKTGIGIQSPVDKRMYFYEGHNSTINSDLSSLDRHLSTIIAYDAYCQKQGIQFIFFPIPNKETIYHELVPYEKQPPYLNLLLQKLMEQNIRVVNTLHLFNQHRNENMLYQYDDSHWNRNGVDLVSEELARLIHP